MIPLLQPRFVLLPQSFALLSKHSPPGGGNPECAGVWPESSAAPPFETTPLPPAPGSCSAAHLCIPAAAQPAALIQTQLWIGN